MNQMNPQVDGFLRKAKRWQAEMRTLRAIILDCCPLAEEMKWRFPCYTFEGRNVVLMHAFKEHCALLFFKGALLKDPKGILVKPGENTQASRQIRFTGLEQIDKLEGVVKAYIREAIELEKSGAKVERKQTVDYEVPQEFQAKLKQLPGLRKAFTALTPGRQRAYLLHFASAKQSQTRASRVAKCVPRILEGKGLDD